MMVIVMKRRSFFETLIIIILMVFVFLLFDIRCLVRTIFHIPCPTCGMTRAWLSVFRLDFESAFYYHPLFLVGPVVVLLFCFYEKWKMNRIYQFICAMFGILLFVVYCLRLTYGLIP